LAKSLTNLLDKHGLRKKIFAYVKDEGFHFNVMTIILKSIVSRESLSLEENFPRLCFGHFSKVCQYRTIEKKVCKNLKYVSIKFAQVPICKSASLGPRNFGRKTRME
jgi:hypothetical protein